MIDYEGYPPDDFTVEELLYEYSMYEATTVKLAFALARAEDVNVEALVADSLLHKLAVDFRHRLREMAA